MSVTGIGGKSGIRLLPNILTGTHKHLRSGEEFTEGRDRFLLDVLLHEMVHQFAEEKLGKPEDGYRGHGPVFAAKCTRVGALLGLPPVRSMKKRGKNAHLPSCQYWPHNVRPEGYYLGAYVPPAGEDEGDEKGGEAEPAPPEPEFVSVPRDPEWMAAAVVRLLTADEVRVFTGAFVAVLEAGSAKVPDVGVPDVPVNRDTAGPAATVNAGQAPAQMTGGEARILVQDALDGGGAWERVAQSFRVGPVVPHAQHPQSVTVSYVDPKRPRQRKPRGASFVVTPDNIRFVTIEAEGREVYDSR
jgi:hypothetical protein